MLTIFNKKKDQMNRSLLSNNETSLIRHEIIYPFDLNDIIIYVKNIINEYEVLRGSL